MATTLYPGTPVPTFRSLPRRWLADLALAWAGWREQRRYARALRALDHLSAQTLKDIGFAELAGTCRRSIAEANFLRGL